MSFFQVMLIFVVIACILYGVIFYHGRRRGWGANRTAAYEGTLFLICGLGSALAYNREMDIPNSLISTIIAPLAIGVFAYFQTAFFYSRLGAYGSGLPGEGVKHKPGKSQYDRERKKRGKRK